MDDKENIDELRHLKELGILPEEEAKGIEESLGILNSLQESEESDNGYKLKIKYINTSDNVNPVYAKVGDSGFDLRCTTGGTLKPLERLLVPTGLFFELPDGYELQVRPRSGLAAKHGVTVLNTPGTVDTGYRGEIKVILVNLSNDEFTFSSGDRIAQAVIASRVSSDFGDLVEVTELSETSRGDGGFGSTGVI